MSTRKTLFKLSLGAMLLACAGGASAKKCVEVTVCDGQGKNCHPEQMCSVYSEQSGGVQTRKAAPPPPSGEPQPLLLPEPVKPACDDTPVAGKPRKICK